MTAPAMPAKKPCPRVRVAAIIVRDNYILLAQHAKEGKTYWVLPGGGVDFGETAAEALVRELKEETNLDIEVGALVMANDSIPPDGHRHILNLYFTAKVTGGRLRIGAGDKRLVGARFVPIDELTSLVLFPDVRELLLEGCRRGFGAGARYLGNLWKDA